MEITVASEKDRTTWDEIVASSDHGTLFHTWDWLKLMEKHTFKKIGPRKVRGRLLPLILWQGEEMTGLMPFYVYDLRFFKLLFSPPLSVEDMYLGPVIGRYQAQKPARRQVKVQKFQEAVSAFIFEEIRPQYISIHTAPFFSDPRSYLWGGYTVTPEFTNIVPLQGTLEYVRERFSHTAREMLNKPGMREMEAFDGSRKDVEFIHTRLSEADRIHAPREFLLDIFDRFHQTNMKVIMVQQNGVTLSGMICLYFNNKACSWLGSHKVGIRPNPNYLAHWESVRWAHEKRFAYLEILGASDLSTFPFKRQFGGDIVPFYSVKWYHPVLRKIRGLLA